VWQGALVALAVAAALRSLRRASASVRYAVSAGALFAMMLLPAATAWRLVRGDVQPAIEALDASRVHAAVDARPARTQAVARTTVDRRPAHPRAPDQAGAERVGVNGLATPAADGLRGPSRGPRVRGSPRCCRGWWRPGPPACSSSRRGCSADGCGRGD